MNAKVERLRALLEMLKQEAEIIARTIPALGTVLADLDSPPEPPKCICCGQPVIARCLGYTDGGWAGVCEAAYHDHFVGPVETSADKALAAYGKLADAIKAYGVER